MKIIIKLAAIALLLFGLVPAVSAGAQATCEQDYCAPTDNEGPGTDEGAEGGSTDNSGGGAEVDAGGAEDAGGAATPGSGANTVGGGAGAGAATAPSGALPITGSDIVGIAALGAVAVALGALLVKRSKAARQLA